MDRRELINPGNPSIKATPMPRCSLIKFGLFAFGVVGFLGCDSSASKREIVEKARAQVQRIADELDSKTTETGIYIRVKEDEVKESDPWGTPVQVSYSQGGVSEMVHVRSAGPDRLLQTEDDVVAMGMTANLKGIGEGIKKNTEDTAAKAAKGLVNGAVEGIKESVKDALPFPRKKEGSDSDVNIE